jgi:hypothetical protein
MARYKVFRSIGVDANYKVLRASFAQKLKDRGDTGSDPDSASIARRIRALKPILLSDCLHGEVVKKDRIPRPVKDKHGMENLFVEDLPSFWRFLCTIVRDRGVRHIVIVEIVDHEMYDGWFGRRSR